MDEEQRKKLANENLQRLQTSMEKQSQRRGFRGYSRGTELKEAELQLASEGEDLSGIGAKKRAMSINERAVANREARGPMAFSTAEGRLIPWDPVTKTRRDQTPVTSPLTQSPNLNFPITEGGTRGMDRETISEKAQTETMRLAGNQRLGLTAQPTNFETAGVKKESGGVIQTPYGIMSSSTPLGQKEFEERVAKSGPDRSESYAMTPSGNFQRQVSGAEDRALALAGMAEKGAAIRSNLEEQSRNRYYAFRQGISERKAQEAMTPSFGNTVGREATMRGAQATIEAERMRQAQQGRSPMSGEPLEVRGMQFRQAGMGQYAPIRGFGDSWQSNFMGGGGPQPMAGMAQAAPATPTPSTASNFWQTSVKAFNAPTTPATSGVFAGSDFGSVLGERIEPIVKQRYGIEDPLERMRSAMGPIGIARNRSLSPVPYGMRG
jgi:hypothetical protein